MTQRDFTYLLIAAVTVVMSPAFAADGTNMQVRGGVLKFEANTNLSAVSVHGQSSSMSADVELHKTDSGIEVQKLRAVIDPKSFSTGMSLRDQHMRKRIFTTESDQLPELEFSSANNLCPSVPAGQDAACQISGNMTLRGVTRPFAMNLKVRNDGKGYKVSGDGVVKLSVFGIEAPCQLGVCVTDDIKVRLEFQLRESMGLRSGGLQ